MTYTQINTAATKWLSAKSDREKLQAIYAVVCIASLLIAGLLSLLDRNLGVKALTITYVSGLVWFVNFITWAIYLTSEQKHGEINSLKAKK